jgi:hypothetical protein
MLTTGVSSAKVQHGHDSASVLLGKVQDVDGSMQAQGSVRSGISLAIIVFPVFFFFFLTFANDSTLGYVSGPATITYSPPSVDP